MKKINLLILTLLIVPQILFSQIKKIDKGTKQSVSKTIKGGNSKGNTKAQSANSGYIIANKCFYSATPQGFTVEINNLTDIQTGAQFHLIKVNKITPVVYSHKINNVNIYAGEEETYLGDQSPNHGILNGGSGWARDESGIILYGNVYRYKGNKFGRGNVYTGSLQEKKLLGFYTGDCSVSSLYIATSHLQGVPSIEGSSTAFNDTSGPQTSSTNVTVENHQSGGTYTMENYAALFDNAFTRKILGDGNVTLNKLTTQEEYDDLRLQIAKLNYEQYVAFREEHPFKFRYLELDHYSLTPIVEEDVQLDITPNNIQEVELVIPIGFGTPDYPSPKMPGGAVGTKKLYPSYLFDEPKGQNWYLGNTAETGPFGKKFNHEPLPSYCNPNNADYIPAAFLNPLVLEELRQDWKYLTWKNVAELKAKGYEFYDDFYSKFWDECTNEINCTNQLITENPNLQRKTYVDPNGTMPIINSTSSQNGTQKSKTDDELNTLPKPKRLVKTEDYYSDLINNKLITINPEWLVIKQQKKCTPKMSAIHNSINTGKKLKRNKRIIKKKN